MISAGAFLIFAILDRDQSARFHESFGLFGWFIYGLIAAVGAAFLRIASHTRINGDLSDGRGDGDMTGPGGVV